MSARPLTLRQAERRGRVLDAAVGLAATGGYEAVQMRDVATGADVAMGTIYRYFESKDHLLAAALVEQARGIREQIANRRLRGADPLERVVRVLRRTGETIEQQPQLFAAFMTAITSSDPAVSACQQEMMDTLSDVLHAAMEGLDQETRDNAVRVLMHVWFSSLVGWVNGWQNVTSVAEELEVAARTLLAKN